MATYDLIGLGDGAGRSFHSIDVEHQLHLLKASDTDVGDVLRSGFQLNLAATAASTKVAAEGMSQMSGQLAAIDEGLAGLAGDVRDGFADLAAGQQEIAAAIDSGFQAVASELVAHRQLLGEIRGLLDELVRVAANPRTTQAAELSRQARTNLEDALKLSGSRRSRLLDEAFDLLTESVTFNAQDFEAQFNLGWVCLVHRHDPVRAAEHFDTAVLRSLTRSPSFAAYASRHLALAQREAGDLPAALTAAAEAAVNAPDDAVTLLDHARYAALAGAPEAADLLRRAIAASPQCWYEAAADPDFAGLGATLDAVLDDAREQARQAATDWRCELDGLLRDNVFTIKTTEEVEVRAALAEVDDRLAQGGYADWRRALARADKIREDLAAALKRWVPIELGTLTVHSDAVCELAISADGCLLASGSGEKVRLWSLPEGRPLATLTGHMGGGGGVAMSPNGCLLAGGSGDGTVRLWSLPEGRALATLTGHSEAVCELVISADGCLLASGSRDKTVRLWSLPEGRALSTLTGHSQEVCALAISPDGCLLASGSGDKVRLWSLPDGRALATLSGCYETVSALAMSPDGCLLASGSTGKTVRLWSLPEGRALATLTGHSEKVCALAMSPDGCLLASGSIDKTVRLWSLPDGRALATLRGHSSTVRALAMSPEGHFLASGSADDTVRLWGIGTALMPSAEWAVVADAKRAIEARQLADVETAARTRAETARAHAEAERQRRLKAEARCLGCERPLGFLDKLAGRSRHAGC